MRDGIRTDSPRPVKRSRHAECTLQGPMMSEALKPRRPLLPEGLTAFDVSDACREGFISFCRGVAQGWTKRDLATWLVGPYARIARLVDAPLMVDDPPPASRTELSRLATNRI